jgi:uncharacterized protein
MTMAARRNQIWAAFAGVVLLGGLSGCVGGAAPSHYYVLAVTEPDTARRADGPSVSIGPVTLPKYLDRPQIVTRPTPNQLDLSEFDRWGGRLEDNIAQVLAEDVARRLKTARVAVFPTEPTGRADSRVAVTITQFERVGDDGDCVLDARWRITRPTGEPLRGNFKVTKRAPGTGYAPTVAAMSAALGDLAATVADAVSGAGRGS